MANLPTQLQRLLDEGYEFQFGEYIGRGFNLIQRNLGGFIGFYLLLFLIFMGSAIIPIIGPLAVVVIAPALIIGPAIVANKMERNQPTQFNDFFQGFSRFGDLFLVVLLTMLITLAALIPGYALIFYSIFSNIGAVTSDLDPSDPFSGFAAIITMFSDPIFLLGALLAVVPAVYLSVSFAWAPFLVWFYKMPAWDAMQASRKIIGKKWWLIFGFTLVIGLIGGLGVLLLGIGILFTYPAMQLANYAAFADVTKLNEAEPEVDVLDHFTPQV